MASVGAPFTVVRYPLISRTVEVARVERVTPSMIRLTLTGEELRGFETRSPADHIKIRFPVSADPGAAAPDGVTRTVMRDYTPRRYDPIANELDIDFFLHGEGIGARWAEQATPGQRIGIAGPRGSKIYAYDAGWFLLFGDETSIPSIARRLQELPAGSRAFAFIEVANAAEEQPLPTDAHCTVAWIHRDEADPSDRSLLERALMWFELPDGPGFVWATGEANDLRSLRRYLINERGIPRESLDFSGHWKRGVADYDHHEAIGE